MSCSSDRRNCLISCLSCISTKNAYLYPKKGQVLHQIYQDFKRKSIFLVFSWRFFLRNWRGPRTSWTMNFDGWRITEQTDRNGDSESHWQWKLKSQTDEPIGSNWTNRFETGGLFQWIGLRENLQETIDFPIKSAHTALAVKACLLGGNSNTKCSMTFVNIAVAISALAGGGQKRFRTETRIRWCFRHFSRIFGCLSARGYWNGILGHFGSFPAMEKRPKMKKTLYIARFCRVFGCQSIENTAKTSVLDWRYSKKRVNYRMLDWKHYKNTVKSNVLEGFTAFMAKNV